MSVEDLLIRVRSVGNVIPEIGIGGFNPGENEVIITIDPDFLSLSDAISNDLGPILAHEMHHAKRRRSVGYGASLLETIVTEGQADRFSMEIFNIDPPIWSLEIQGAELENLIEEASQSWTSVPYDHDEWFLGASNDIPRWAGYCIGYKLVNDFLLKNPSRQASDLHNEPAGSFID